MAAGLFELRKDAITGWWVATVVDREFHRDRFARAAEPVADVDCQNCRLPDGPGVRTRTLKDFAFHTVGTDDEARELDRGVAQVAIATARASGSWRTVVAPPGEHRALHAVGSATIEALVEGARSALAEAQYAGQTDYLQVVQNWGVQAGARTNHLCLDLYDLRQVPATLAAALDGPPYNLVLHTAPLREQVDATYHWHWEIHPRLREIAGLELGTGLPVNPVSPEDAVEELLSRARSLAEASG